MSAPGETRRLSALHGPTRLLLALVAGSFMVWQLGGLGPRAALTASEAEARFATAYVSGDYAAASEAGLERLALDGVLRPGLGFRAQVSDALHRAGREAAALKIAGGALDYALEREGEESAAAAMARNNLAWLLLSLSERTRAEAERARALAARAVEQDPQNPYYLGTLGTAELRLGRLREARTHLERAIELHGSPPARATDEAVLAIVLHGLGEDAAARDMLSRARQDGQPDEPYLGEALEALGLDDRAPADPARPPKGDVRPERQRPRSI